MSTISRSRDHVETLTVSAARRWWSRRWLRPTVLYAVLVAGGIVFGIPFYWLLSGSLKDEQQYNQFPPTWLPHPPIWRNYAALFQNLPFGQMLVNSALVTAGVVAGVVASSAVVAYAFARLRAPGRRFLFAILLATIILPGEVTIVPTYILFSKLGWLNSFKPLIVPNFFGDAFSIFLIRQFFQGIPRELDEAALLDGCGYWGVFRHVFVPNSWPVLATVAIFAFINTWGDFFTPLIYLNDFNKMTAAVGLAFLNIQRNGGSYNLQELLAGSLLMITPMMLVFIVLQRYFVKAITLTGIKG